jgi:hypothetical protein
MDDYTSTRTVAPDAVIKFDDASITWDDWHDFLEGYGTISSSLLGSNASFNVNTGHMAPMRAMQMPVCFVGEIHLTLGGNKWSDSRLKVTAEADVTIDKPTLQEWEKTIRRLLGRVGATTNPDVWPLLQIDGWTNFDDYVWSVVRRPENNAIARAMMKKNKHGVAFTVRMAVQGDMNIDDVRTLKQRACENVVWSNKL